MYTSRTVIVFFLTIVIIIQTITLAATVSSNSNTLKGQKVIGLESFFRNTKISKFPVPACWPTEILLEEKRSEEPYYAEEIRGSSYSQGVFYEGREASKTGFNVKYNDAIYIVKEAKIMVSYRISFTYTIKSYSSAKDFFEKALNDAKSTTPVINEEEGIGVYDDVITGKNYYVAIKDTHDMVDLENNVLMHSMSLYVEHLGYIDKNVTFEYKGDIFTDATVLTQADIYFSIVRMYILEEVTGIPMSKSGLRKFLARVEAVDPLSKGLCGNLGQVVANIREDYIHWLEKIRADLGYEMHKGAELRSSLNIINFNIYTEDSVLYVSLDIDYSLDKLFYTGFIVVDTVFDETNLAEPGLWFYGQVYWIKIEGDRTSDYRGREKIVLVYDLADMVDKGVKLDLDPTKMHEVSVKVTILGIPRYSGPYRSELPPIGDKYGDKYVMDSIVRQVDIKLSNESIQTMDMSESTPVEEIPMEPTEATEETSILEDILLNTSNGGQQKQLLNVLKYAIPVIVGSIAGLAIALILAYYRH